MWFRPETWTEAMDRRCRELAEMSTRRLAEKQKAKRAMPPESRPVAAEAAPAKVPSTDAT